MLIKWAKRNIRRLLLLVAIVTFTAIVIELTVRQYCVCTVCEVVGQPPEPCRCTSLARHYLRRALGQNDFDDSSTSRDRDDRNQNEASESKSQGPCAYVR
jgi:hypothetical protein